VVWAVDPARTGCHGPGRRLDQAKEKGRHPAIDGLRFFQHSDDQSAARALPLPIVGTGSSLAIGASLEDRPVALGRQWAFRRLTTSAGTRRDQTTDDQRFSLRALQRVDAAPKTAASVSTRVVSWNDGPPRLNDLVCRLALVMPSRTGSALGGPQPSPAPELGVSPSRIPACRTARRSGTSKSPGIDDSRPSAASERAIVSMCFVVDLHALQSIEPPWISFTRYSASFSMPEHAQNVRAATGFAVDQQVRRALDGSRLPGRKCACPLGIRLFDRLGPRPRETIRIAALVLVVLAELDASPRLSQMIAKSLGLRASNSSANPRQTDPVMSRFFAALARDARARMSPACISLAVFSTDRMASSESR